MIHAKKIPIGIDYRIADYVAWCNNNGIELKQVIKVDIKDLQSKIIKKLA
jgi:hypothetical protein